jgi:hypothetical protein
VFPGHVWDFDDASVAFERWLDELGGEVDDEDLDVSAIVNASGDEVALRFGRVGIRFPAAGTILVVALDVDLELTPIFYKFDFRHDDGRLIWRYDMHRGHEREDGVPWHVHEGDEHRRFPTKPTCLAKVRDRLVAFNADCCR